MALALTACGWESPVADLQGPQVVGSSLRPPLEVQVGVWPRLEVALSEALDPESVHQGSVALVPWVEVGQCQLTPVCERGVCQRGHCLEDPLTAADLGRLDRGAYEGEDAVGTPILDMGEGGVILRWVLDGPLRPRWRYAWVVGAGVRDRSGAPLQDGRGTTGSWRMDFGTAGEGSSGPEAKLVSPVHDARGVPTNLARIETAVPVPVDFDPAATLELEAWGGEALHLVDPQPCTGWVPGLCVSWALPGPLEPNRAYRPGGGTLRDRHGRHAVVPRARTWFTTGPGPDHGEPDLSGLGIELVDRCVRVVGEVGETLHIRLEAGGRSAVAQGSGPVQLGVDLSGLPGLPLETVAVRVSAMDGAGNGAELHGRVELGPAFGPGVPRLAISEVLGNPRGAEPDQEFVELVGVGLDADRSVALEGLYLADLPGPDVLERLAAGERPGDALPAAELGPGQVAVIVGDAYGVEPGGDPPPAADALLLRLGDSIATGGLKNAGEPLTLYRAEPPVIVSTHGPPATAPGNGVSLVRAPSDACDLPGAWSPHATGASSPGTVP